MIAYGKIQSLTDEPYTHWGKRYNSFDWHPNWFTFIRIQNKEVGPTRDRTGKDWYHYYKPSVHYVIYFFDRYILQRIREDNKQTLDVRIRITCGLINKIDYIPWTMKREFMECIWDAYKKFYKSWYEYYYKYILELPF